MSLVYALCHATNLKVNETFYILRARLGESYWRLCKTKRENARKEFTNAPETFYTGKEQWIMGKLELYKNKPEIMIYTAGQITDIMAEPVAK